MQSFNSSKGFTLIEVMVAMVIASITVTVVLSGIGVAFDTWGATAARTNQTDSERYQWRTLSRQLEGALPVTRVVEDGLTRTAVLAFEGDSDMVRFVSRTTFSAGPFAPARWVEWRADNTGELEVRESDMVPPDNAPAEESAWSGTIEDVAVRFDFLRPGRGGEPPEWVDEWRSITEQSLPDAVRLTGTAGRAEIWMLIRLDYAGSGRGGLILR